MVALLDDVKKQTETDENVNAILERLGVKYSGTGAGAGLVRDGWTCDGWIVCLQKGNTIARFDFFTGVGLRVISRMEKARIKDWHKGASARHIAQAIEHAAKPYAPKPSQVLYGLTLDAQAIDSSFTVWCDEFGYSNDSLKALDVYRACCDNAQKLYSIFTRQDIAKLREILADY